MALREIFPDARIDLVKRSESKQPIDGLIENKINLLQGFEATSDLQYDLAVIASPATLHCDDTLRIVQQSKSLLIEKPITSNLTSALEIQNILKDTKQKSRVAYHLRFSETVIKLKELIDSAKFGKLSSAEFNYSQDLSLWRPKVDERQSVSARKELGGGVLLEFSHEIEAVQYLMGRVHSISACLMSTHGANTDGKVETLASFSGETKNGENFFIHLDMITNPPKRKWNFKFECAQIDVDLLSGKIFISENGTDFYKFHNSAPFERDRAEIFMLRSFLDQPTYNKLDLCTIDEATDVIKVIDTVKELEEFKAQDNFMTTRPMQEKR